MTVRSQFIILLLLACSALLSFAGQTNNDETLPAAPGSKVIRINPEAGFFNEPAIAVNPSNPQQLVTAFQVTASIAYSTDAGQSWTIAEGTAPSDYRVSGDVSVTYDKRGRAYLCYIAFDKLGTQNYWAHNATRNGVFVRRSLDGGKTWDKQASPVLAHNTEPGIPFEDKPYIVADATQSRFAGNLYVGWTQFSLQKSILIFSRSTDGGLTWSKPIEISSHEGLPRDDTGAVEGFTGAVGTDGTLYAVWADGSEIAFASSRDGGRSFSRSRAILKTAPSYFALQNVDRGNGFPQIGIDPRSNRLFVTWADYRNGDIDVFSSTSTDRGKHWSPALRINSDALHNGADQFFQWLAVDPLDGSANVIFYDRRGDPENRKITPILARSTDGGKTFRNYAWDSQPFDPDARFIGDYNGIAALGGRVYGTWARVPAAPPVKSDVDKTMKTGSFIEVGVADFSREK
ncbi:MAG TPA: sialidase family protein [Terriglobales bacterium]|nr:sialidase family protein [Terriglobales bacterium]